MRCFRLIAPLGLVGLLIASSAQAASPYVGQNKAAAVCAQCHGMRTPAEGSIFPSLVGRDPNYLKNALKQYRNKTRVSELMNNIAGSLSDDDINDIVSYYSSVKPYGMPYLLLLLLIAQSATAGSPDPQRQAELLNMLKHDCGSCHGLPPKGGLGPSLMPEALAGKSDALLFDAIQHARLATFPQC